MGDKDDDGGADETNANVSRYHVMPSLVGLQLMRNRLHLAHTGKKLMKWTALATGRELRKLSKDMVDVYDSFRDDMRQCFMLLARARYFNPYVNDIVVNNPSNTASIRVEKSYKSISGVKVVQLIILDNGTDSYSHLGIGRGGIMIAEAKKAWRELLKRVIFMSQEREDFMGLELAHKNSTKRQNVITKVVIPRLKLTIRYILSELEEKEREDTFRLKRFKELKTKKEKKNKRGSNDVCAICSANPGDGKGPCPKSTDKDGPVSLCALTKPSEESNKKVVINTDNLKDRQSSKPSSSCKSPGADNSRKDFLEDSPLCGLCKQLLNDSSLAKEPSDIGTVDKSTSGHVKDACNSCTLEPQPSISVTSCKSCPSLVGAHRADDKESKLIFAAAQACGCQSIKIIPHLKCDWFDEILKVDGPGKIELKADILENIKSIFLLPPTCKRSSSRTEITNKDSKGASLCSSCQADIGSENEIEIDKCKSCGTLSASIKSCKSVAAETKSSKGKPEKRKAPPKHKCDLGSEPSFSASLSGCSSKDAKANTKNTTKSNVRGVKSSPVTNNKNASPDCGCKSDTTLMENKKQY